MAFKTHNNSFSKGWQQDIDPRLQDPATYRDPKNISVTSDGDFYTAKNLAGSTELQEIVSAGFAASHVNVLGAFECTGTYTGYGGEEKNKSIIFFTKEIGGVGLDKISLYDVVRDKFTTLLTTSPGTPLEFNSLDFPTNGTIDAVVFGDRGTDIIYWDDHLNPLRSILINDLGVTNTRDMVAAPFAPIDPINYYTQVDGSGQLASGSYQFAYRYFSLSTKKFTTWSLLTNPAPVYPASFEDVDRLDAIYGGVANEETKKAIVLQVDKDATNSAIYDSIQLAVVKHTAGLQSSPTIAYLTDPSEEWFNTPTNIVYNGSGLESVIDIGEVSIENACIESAKTLVVKDNVLFRGNVKYSDRDVPSLAFTSAETITDSIGLSSDVYLPTSENTNNPVFTVITGDPGLTQDANENVFRIYNTDAEFGGNPVDPQYTGASGTIDGYTALTRDDASEGTDNDTFATLSLPNDLEAGNIISLRIKGYVQGMIKNDVGLEWKWYSSYYVASLNDAGRSTAGVPNSSPSPEGELTDVDVNLRYTVTATDTVGTIASNIAYELSSIIPTTKAIITQESTQQLKFRNTYPAVDYAVAPGDEPRVGMLDVFYSIENGIDLSASDSTTELDELVSDPDSKEGGYKNPRNVVDKKGYFRDEVYRFALTFQDKFGCWSRPTPFDFSSLKSRDIISFGNTYTFLDQNAGENLARVDLADTTLQVGDFLGIQEGVGGASVDTVYFPISGIAGSGQYYVSWSSEDFGDLTALRSAWDGGTVTFAITRGAEFSFATSGSDWKFPNRENGMYPMITSADANDYGKLQPLGLKVTGISTAPSWAVSYAVVRVKRLIDIVWQSPHLATMASMPSIDPDGCETPSAGGISTGAYGPKILSKGIVRNHERPTPLDGSENIAYRIHQNKGLNNINAASVCTPPEYLMQQSGINFDTVITPSGSKLEIVDAVALYRTDNLNVKGTGPSLGNDEDDQIPLGLRADSVFSYYHRGQDFGTYTAEECRLLLRLDVFDEIGHMPVSGFAKVLSYGELTNRGAQYTFPTKLNGGNSRLNRLQEFGLEPTSLYNCSNEIIQQKQLVVLTDRNFGDLSWYAAKPTITLESINVATSSVLRFDVGPGSAVNMNCDDSVYFGGPYPITGTQIVTSFSGLATPTTFGEGPSSVVPIVNLKRGLADNRYGDLEDVYQYIFTGTYGLISAGVPFDVDIWGGDCFITKHHSKVCDSSTELELSGFWPVYESGVGSISFPTRDNGNKPRVVGLSDEQEVMSLYLESRVNSDLQADPFIYPVLDKGTLAEFSTDYLYPYNFSYSIENESKVWTSKSITENTNRLDFPSRIIYSNPRVYQSDVEGFNEFEALSFYDLQEEYGGITKLTKLANNNVYSIQESGVSVLPINKNVIEDGAGDQIVINSSTLINTPQYLLTQNGSQHIRSVVNSETHIFFMDAWKREIFKIGGGQDGKVSDYGLYSQFLTDLFSSTFIPDDHIVSGYDFNNNEYWIGFNKFTDTEYDNGTGTPLNIPTFLNVWSDKINAWMTEISIDSDTEFENFCFSRSQNFIFGKKADNSYVIEELYTGTTTGEILGEVNASSFTFIVNPEVVQGKTFDVVRIDATERVDNLIMFIDKEDGTSVQISVMDANVTPRHDGYEFPILRDSAGRRLRGKLTQCQIIMNNGDTRTIDIASVTTKYRLSGRTFR